MSYQPIAPVVHLIPIRIALAAIGALACFVLASRHSGKKRRTLVLRNALELAAVPLTLWIAFQVYAAVIQQPDHIRLTYRGNTYAIPRVYRPAQSTEKNLYEYINVAICYHSGLPIYAGPCTASSQIKLSTRPMVEEFYVYSSLDQADATYDGDVITNRGNGAEVLPDGSFEYHQGAYRNRFLLEKSGQIERFAHCYPLVESCTISARTPQGILTFPAKATDVGATNFWREKEEDWVAAFDGWQCAEATCGGRFD